VAVTPHAGKENVREFWDRAPCGEIYAEGESPEEGLRLQSEARFTLEPYIHDFARFPDGRGKDVLEIGVGMGIDHLEWAKSQPRSLSGVDLTPKAVEYTQSRLRSLGFSSEVQVADAEALPFSAESFDLVYSYGVLHHTPDTERAVAEVHRVLRRSGTARIMLYHKPSLVGLMLWSRYALLVGKPWRGLDAIYAAHLESPGTRAFSVRGARKLFAAFSSATFRVQLSFGDLLLGEVGQRHRGTLLGLAKALWPRRLIRMCCGRLGHVLLIEARK
jgi:SAM-dependent methyltransferase